MKKDREKYHSPSSTVELTSGGVLDGIHSAVHNDLACWSLGHYKEFDESGVWMPATQKAVGRDVEEDSVIFTSPLCAEVVKGWRSSKLPANFHPAGFCARLNPPLLTSTPSLPKSWTDCQGLNDSGEPLWATR